MFWTENKKKAYYVRASKKEITCMQEKNDWRFRKWRKSQDMTISEDKNGHEDDQKSSRKPSKAKVFKFPAPIVEEVYKAIRLNRKAKYSWLQDNLGVSRLL